jgi:multidrug efflux pump
MNLSKIFIDRPIATLMLMLAVVMLGGAAYPLLAVSALPRVDFPTIQVSASYPGASPETMAALLAAPLERQFSQIPGVTELTSTSSSGSTSVTLQFELGHDLNGAAQDV